MQNDENRISEIDEGMNVTHAQLPTLMEDPFPRVQSAPVFPRRGSDADTGICSNGSQSHSRTESTTSTRSSSPTASLASQPLTLIDKIQVRSACRFHT